VFTNAGSGSTAFDATITKDVPSGQPSKFRGIYFRSDMNSFIKFTSLKLAHTLSVHAWVMIQTAADMTLFSKDRGVFTASTDKQHLRMFVSADGKMNVSFARDNDSTAYTTKTSTATLSLNVWAYVVYSIEMTGGADTKLTLYKDNVAGTVLTYTNSFIVDKATYDAFIGVERSAATTYLNKWNGFLYNF
jgi:hypothetical protein